jgi:hypothetical protein
MATAKRHQQLMKIRTEITTTIECIVPDKCEGMQLA